MSILVVTGLTNIISMADQLITDLTTINHSACLLVTGGAQGQSV